MYFFVRQRTVQVTVLSVRQGAITKHLVYHKVSSHPLKIEIFRFETSNGAEDSAFCTARRHSAVNQFILYHQFT